MTNAASPTANEGNAISSWEITLFSLKQWLKSAAPYLSLLGIMGFVVIWYLTTERLKLPWFKKLPGPMTVFTEWFSQDPAYGISVYSPEYYVHIFKSIWRVVQAFFLATFLGVPIGLFMGWKKTFKDYTFPLLETLRPIPMLAWVPLSILMWPGREASIIFLTFLGSFFATVLNTLLVWNPSTKRISVLRAAWAPNLAIFFSRSSCRARSPSSSPAFRSAWALPGSRWWPAKCWPANTGSATSSGIRSSWSNTRSSLSPW